jgi:hypothetical protein
MNHTYDIEVYPNVWTLAAKTYETGYRHMFEISFRRNDIAELWSWVQSIRQDRMIGFNNVGYDYPVLHFVLSHYNATPADIYRFSISIIESDDRFGHIIWDRDQIVPQVDLYKIHHFDNRAKTTSLKILEFNMRSQSIVDLPFPPGTMLTSDQIDTLKVYNNHDVDQTEAFMVHSADSIKFREYLSEKYGRNFLNHNDTKIGKDYLIAELERINPGSCYHKVDGRRQPRQTHRPTIAFKDIIFPYVRFERPEFNSVLNWLQDTTISGYDTKDCIKVWSAWDKKAKVAVGEYHTEREVVLPGEGWQPKSKPLSCTVDGFQFDFGTGGIHGSIDGAIVEANQLECILDLDVTSYYPSLGIVNRIYPEHLGTTFCDVYADIKKQRVSYAKGTPENKMLKLALNGTYGDTNSLFSPLYDPQYTMAITINGQLLLCMLAEQMLKIPGLKMIQVNTDGLTIKVHRGYLQHIGKVRDWWCGVTGLELEHAFYKRMLIRDVNNYISEYEDGHLKRKGAYEYKLGWHQNHSALVIQMAAEAALVHGTQIEQFIYNHSEPLDFMLRTKVNRKDRLLLDEKQVQNVTRYYISTNGGSLVKVMQPLKGKTDERRIGINVGWKVTECNNLVKTIADIDYRYYIKEAYKLVKPLKERL